MMTITKFLSFTTLISTVTNSCAFTPVSTNSHLSLMTSSSTELNIAKELDSMIGSDIENGNKPWDPLGVSDYIPPSYARAAELANGRTAMLATVGYVFPKYVFHFDGKVSIDDPIAAIGQADVQWWAQFVIFCASCECFIYQSELNGKTSKGGLDGEPVLDWSGMYPSDAEGRTKIQLQEIKNGRLAMLGIAGMVYNHFVPGATLWSPGF